MNRDIVNMFLPTFLLLACLHHQDNAFGNGVNAQSTYDEDSFDFSALENELLEHIETNLQLQIPDSQIPESLVAPKHDLPDVQDRKEDEELAARIKQLQSFHADLTKSSDDDPSSNELAMGFTNHKVSTGSTLASAVDQLMAKHGVTVQMVEGTTEQHSSGSADLGINGLKFTIDLGQIEEATNEQLWKRVEYMENNFHKDDIEALSDPCTPNPCDNAGVCSVQGDSYACQCAENYVGINCDKYDVDECSLGTHDCDEITSFCVNTVGSFTCECKEGFFDDGYGFGCMATECSLPIFLAGADVTSMFRTRDGTVVTYSCRMEFIFKEGNPEAKCFFRTGIWELSTMECTPTLCFYSIENYAVYAGTTNRVLGSVPCQRFDSHTPHAHRTWANYPYFFRASSFDDVGNNCRDPEQSRVPWCYTIDPNGRSYYCDIPQCEQDPICSIAPFVPGAKVASLKLSRNRHISAEYECLEGLVQVNNLTASCQGLVYYDNGHRYFEDWDIDDIMCEPMDCIMFVRFYASYHGTKNTTKSGRTCQRWDSQYPHKHDLDDIKYFPGIKRLHEVANFCRDPTKSRIAWCFTTDPLVLREPCDINPCAFLGSPA